MDNTFYAKISREEPPSPRKKLRMGLLLFAFLLVAIPLTLKLISQPQEIRQRAQVTFGPGELAKVGGITITEQDLKSQMQQAYGNRTEEAYRKNEIRNTFLEGLIKQKIVEGEGEKRGIAISQKDIEQEKLAFLPRQGSGRPLAIVEAPFFSAADDERIKRRLLQESVENKVVTWRQVDLAASYNNGDDIAGLEKSQNSLKKLKELILQGKTMKEAYNLAKQTPNFEPHIQYFENVTIKGPLWGRRDISPILRLHSGNVEIMNLGAGSYILVKVLDENNTRYASYNDWVEDQKKTVQRK